LWVLNKKAFGPIQRALDARRQAITESVEAAERTKQEAEDMLGQYKAQLAEARNEADAIVERARKAGDELTARIKTEAETQRAEQLKQTQQQVQAEIDRAMSELRASVADMTVTAAEKVLKGSLDQQAHQQLIEQAVSELDFDSLQKVGAGR
jgi:F-type H+-transporting ATPase subunit b